MRWTSFIAAITLLSLGTPSSAYVCSRVTTMSGPDTGPSLSWFSRTIPIHFQQDGTSQIDGDSEFAVLMSSFRTWEELQNQECSSASTDLTFDFGQGNSPQLTASRWVGYNYLNPADNQNVILFWDENWPHPELNGVIALTTTTHIPQDGRIIDADIELNATNFEFGILSNAESGTTTTDLANTMVHEIGHLLGLGHTSDPQATMFASASPGETLKRTLDCDDIAAIDFKYPANEPNGYCAESTPSCTCVEPNESGTNPTIAQTDSFDSFETSGCAGNPAPGLFGFLIALLFRYRTRKTSSISDS